ncbi:hypothetical protein Asi02nite_37070 [Asanoa siamensis]|uniref:Uncharacterized protein n=1 Tax=Asanoa siamensis TaxID=926357 RepID=A0ABQ4CSC4_9ACTN|nr:hypothetical protein Asi02nite_37070 [Asanoa siamensis]
MPAANAANSTDPAGAPTRSRQEGQRAEGRNAVDRHGYASGCAQWSQERRQGSPTGTAKNATAARNGGVIAATSHHDAGNLALRSAIRTFPSSSAIRATPGRASLDTRGRRRQAAARAFYTQGWCKEKRPRKGAVGPGHKPWRGNDTIALWRGAEQAR